MPEVRLGLLLGLLGFGVVLATTHGGGPGLSPDSAVYLSAADSVVHDHRFGALAPGEDLTLFPPLYPLLLVPGEGLGDPLMGARLIAALAYGLLVGAGAFGAARIARGFAAPIVTGVALIVATPLVETASFAWSDVPFALFVALFLLAASAIGTSGNTVALAGSFAALAILTRYIGVVTVLVGLVPVFLWSRSRVRDSVLFLALAVLAPAAWFARNILVSSTLTGDRRSASESLETGVRDAARTIGAWVAPGNAIVGLALAVAIVLAALLTASRLRPSRLELVVLLFTGVYLVVLVNSTVTVALDPIDDRFLVPIYVPLVWLAVGAFTRGGAMATPRLGRKLISGLLVVALAAWIVTQAARFPALFESVEAFSSESLPRWTTEDERHARALSTQLYTNAPDVVFLRTGTRIPSSPRKAAYRSDEPIDELTPLAQVVESAGSAALIWFPDVHRASAYTPSELAAHLRVRRFRATPDATLYVLAPAR